MTSRRLFRPLLLTRALSSTSRHSQLPAEMNQFFSRTKKQYSALNERLLGDLSSSELTKAAKELSSIGKTIELIEERERILKSINDLEVMMEEEKNK